MFIIDGIYFDTEYRSLALAMKECIDKSLKVLVTCLYVRTGSQPHVPPLEHEFVAYRGYIVVPNLVPVMSHTMNPQTEREVYTLELNLIEQIQHSNQVIGGTIWNMDEEIAFKRLESIVRLHEIQDTLTKEKSERCPQE